MRSRAASSKSDDLLAGDVLDLIQVNGHPAVLEGETLHCGSTQVRLRNGIPRFTPDQSYSTGNFSMLREKHALLQFDSRNGTNDRLRTILTRTNWPREYFRGKLVLECGCRAGPDTEVLRSLGCHVVAVDVAGVDIAQRNAGRDGVQFVQASIMDLPFKPKSFDIVFCHRVLQHTPDPEGTLDHILTFVKDDGAVFVHSYAKTLRQLLRWKYVLRPITTRMNPNKIYRLIERSAPALYRVTKVLNRHYLGKKIAWHAIPFLNYDRKPKFSGASEDFIIEYGIHDTFDALSPKYDRPLSASTMRSVAAGHLKQPFEVVQPDGTNITLLRTLGT